MTYGASQWRTGNDLALKQDEERHVTEQDMAVSTDTNSRQTGVSRRTVYIYIYIYIYINTGVSEKSATSIFIVNWLQNVGMMSNRHTGLHLPMCTASEFRCNNGER